ncbi:MAG: hypothetical protein ABIB47_00415 [Candidatus Woesearchaeota archaeon]
MKKAQIQFMEMIFVLLILIIIIFIGMFLYFSFSSKSIQKKGEELLDLDAAILTDAVIGVPEITCGSNCVDTLKIINFDSRDPALGTYYLNSYNSPSGRFKNMNITIRRVWPVPVNEDVECDLGKFNEVGRYPDDNCGYFVVNKGIKQPGQSKEIIQNAVALYYPTKERYEFGLIRIEVFK